MVIVDQNPLENFKMLYATGAVKLNDQNGRVERVGGIKYTIKDGIVYDAKKLAADVAAIVERAKRRAGDVGGTAITDEDTVEDRRRGLLVLLLVVVAAAASAYLYVRVSERAVAELHSRSSRRRNGWRAAST